MKGAGYEDVQMIMFTSWCFQLIWKIQEKLDHFPRGKQIIKQIFETTHFVQWSKRIHTAYIIL